MSGVWRAFTRAGGQATGVRREQLEASIAEAAAAWPEIEVDPAVLAAELGARAAMADANPEKLLGAAADLHLALACSCGDRVAIDAFEQRYFAAVPAAVRGILPASQSPDDVCQRLRTRLFVAEPHGRVPIVDYAGAGDLAALVRIAAVRIALNLQRDENRRRRREHEFTDDPTDLDAAADDVELELVKRTHRARFKEAFEHAVDSLTPRARTLLRHHLVDSLSIDDLGTLYGVHRSTVSRWLAAARADVGARTREHLTDLLQGDDALPALLELIESRLDLSVSRVFTST